MSSMGLFLVVVGVHLVVQLWLMRRQLRHVLQHRQHLPAPLSGAITAEAHAKAADYTSAHTHLAIVRLVVGMALLLAWTLGGGLEVINRAILELLGGEAAAAGRLAYPVLLLAVVTVISGLLDLPFDWYSTFRIEQRFGFNRMGQGLWARDQALHFILAMVIELPLLAVVAWLMDAAGSGWWLWAFAVWSGFTLLLMFVYPQFIAPLFNEFKPLEDASLRERVNALLQRSGFSARGFFVMDGSRRSAESNAYLTGLGRAKRVVFYDTLLQQLSPAEVEAVLAHELGHDHHRHLPKTLAVLFALSLAGFAALGWLAAQPQFYLALGVTPNASASNSALALLLFLMLLPLGSTAGSLVANRFSRRHEFEADAYAARHSSAADLSTALIKLTDANASTLTPDPQYVRFNYSHPPLLDRLAALTAAAPPPVAGVKAP